MKRMEYTGLTTTRVSVECASLMVVSNAKVKVKTDTKTYEWEEVEEYEPLSTSITSEHSF